ncbi:MAG: hypothetical protein GY793_07585 [Proteobacteria bacterium]|nr:hypothetical protein [Pseudomonadota bacterium]
MEKTLKRRICDIEKAIKGMVATTEGEKEKIYNLIEISKSTQEHMMSYCRISLGMDELRAFKKRLTDLGL